MKTWDFEKKTDGEWSRILHLIKLSVTFINKGRIYVTRIVYTKRNVRSFQFIVICLRVVRSFAIRKL